MRPQDRLERLGNYLTDADSDRMLRDVEDFARRQPWLVAGGGMLLGLFGSRLLKASSSRRYELSDQSNGQSSYGTRSLYPAIESSYGSPALTVGAPIADELLPASDLSTGSALPDATPTAFPASPSTAKGKTGGSGTSGEPRGQ